MAIKLKKEVLEEDIITEDLVKKDLIQEEFYQEEFYQEDIVREDLTSSVVNINKPSALENKPKVNLETINEVVESKHETNIEKTNKTIENNKTVNVSKQVKPSNTTGSSEFLKLEKQKKHKKLQKQEKPTGLVTVLIILFVGIGVLAIISLGKDVEPAEVVEYNPSYELVQTDDQTYKTFLETTETTKQTEETEETEATAQPVDEVEAEVEEVVKEPVQVTTETVYYAPQEGVSITNGEIKASNFGDEPNREKEDTIIFYGTLTNTTDYLAYSNVKVKLTLFNEEAVVLTEYYNVLTDVVLEPSESKQFEVECRVRGKATKYQINVLTADIVKVYEDKK